MEKKWIRTFGFITIFIWFVSKNSSLDFLTLLVPQRNFKIIWRLRKGIVGWTILYTGKKSILLKYCYSCSSISITFCESFPVFEITESCDSILINATRTKIERKKEVWAYFGSDERWYYGNCLHSKRFSRNKWLFCIYALDWRHIFQAPCLVILNIY